MPELPEVETVAVALNQALVGRTVSRSRFLGKTRYDFDAVTVSRVLGGQTIHAVRRRAKYLVFDFDGQDALLAHLGMTGFFHIDPVSEAELRHDRIAFGLDNDEELRFADARRFGFIKLVRISERDGWPDELGRLGPEPLSRQCTGSAMHQRAKSRTCPVKNFIMDQTVLVGVGNIYASEALFHSGIDPRRQAGSLSLAEWIVLTRRIKNTLRSAIKSGGSTIRSYRQVDGSEGGFQRVLHVYGKKDKPCSRCGGTIQTIRQGGRSTYFCPGCQR